MGRAGLGLGLGWPVGRAQGILGGAREGVSLGLLHISQPGPQSWPCDSRGLASSGCRSSVSDGAARESRCWSPTAPEAEQPALPHGRVLVGTLCGSQGAPSLRVLTRAQGALWVSSFESTDLTHVSSTRIHFGGSGFPA